MLFSANAMAASGPAQELIGLIEALENSPSYELWHENREALETRGFEIWKQNRTDDLFCKKLKTEASDSFVLAAWSSLEPSGCTILPTGPTEAPESAFQSFPILESCNPEYANNNSLGPSREAIIDTRGGPRLVTGDLNRCEVAFTFDDGPHPILTERLLEILKDENVRANFFTVGRNVDRYPQITDQVAQAGHVVGNHSYSHKNFPKFSFNEIKLEIIKGFQSLLGLWDFTTPFFRYPYGAFTKKSRKYLQDHDVAEFFWNMDTRDWAIKNPNDLYRNVLKELNREKRGILLFHDVHSQTIEVIPNVLIALKQAGYTTAVFVPDELIEGDFPNE